MMSYDLNLIQLFCQKIFSLFPTIPKYSSLGGPGLTGATWKNGAVEMKKSSVAVADIFSIAKIYSLLKLCFFVILCK